MWWVLSKPSDLCSSQLELQQWFNITQVDDNNAVNMGFPDPPFARLVVGTWCWWLTDHSSYVRLWSRYHYYQHNLFYASSTHTEDGRPYPHMSTEVYQNKKPIRFEDIQILLYRLLLFSSRPNIEQKLC